MFDVITERKKADEALRQKEAALNEAQRIAHVGSWYWDAKTDVTTGTAELLRIYGFDPAAQLMPDFREQRGRCYPVEEWERVNAAVQTSLQAGIGYELDVQAIRDGETIWVTTRGEAVRDRDGQIVGLRGTVQDITERKHIEEELRESEAKYRTLFDNMTEEVHFWEVVRDEAGRIKTWRLVDANPPTLNSWGRTSLDEIKEKTTDEIFGPGASDHYMPVVQKIMTEGVPYSFEDYFPNLDKYFRFTSVPIGEYFITTGADITGIKKAEQALRMANDELELRVRERTAELVSANEDLQKQAALLNLSHDAIFVVDSADVVSFWNKGAEDLYGFTREQAIGNVASEFLQTRFPESLEQVVNQVIDKGQWAGELGHTTSKGKELVVESRWALRRGEDGKPTGFLEVNRDITSRKIIEEEFRKADRAFRTLSECNQAMVRQTEEMELLQQVCRIVVDVGGYRMAWVGLRKMTKTKPSFRLHPPDTTRVIWIRQKLHGPIPRGAEDRPEPPFAPAKSLLHKTPSQILLMHHGARRRPGGATLLPSRYP